MFGASSVVSVENATSMPESGAKVDDDELLAGVKCDSDDGECRSQPRVKVDYILTFAL